MLGESGGDLSSRSPVAIDETPSKGVKFEESRSTIGYSENPPPRNEVATGDENGRGNSALSIKTLSSGPASADASLSVSSNSFPMLATPDGLLVHPQTPYSLNMPVESNAVRPKLQNIVCTVNLGCNLSLKHIAKRARNAEYNPKRFAAVIMRIKDPRTTALIFSSGRMVCTGAKSEEFAKLAARKYARIIQQLGYDVKFKDFKIQNIVGSCDVGFPIRLEGLVLTHGQFCSYEPELFPGLIYRMVKPKIVLLVFVSGKVVLTGAKERKDIEEAFDSISPILRGFRKY